MSDDLIARLDAGMAPGIRLALLVAPAGWGKTALLRRWGVAARWPVVWIDFRPADNDGAEFISHLGSAIAAAFPALPEPTVLGVGGPAVLLDAMTELIDDLAAMAAGEWALVLDDYHQICAAAVQAEVARLLEYPPPGLHVYLACRIPPALPVARLRVRRQLVELAP